MRVLMINRNSSYSVLGGDTIQMEKTSHELQKLGVDVKINLTSDILRNSDKSNIDILHIFNIQTAEESYRVYDRFRNTGIPLVVSSIYWNPYVAWFYEAVENKYIWRKAKSVLGNNLTFSLYLNWQRIKSPTRKDWNYQRELLLAADILLPNSRAEASMLMKDFALGKGCKGKITVVPNAIDRHLFTITPQKNTNSYTPDYLENFILSVCRISPEKNCLGLIEALWDVKVPIVFVGGESPLCPEYVKICNQRGAERGNVLFLGQVPHEELTGIYAKALVHVLPSWRETPGLASLEAAAAGCRVVTTSIGSAYEYFGDAAWYCDPASKKSIKNAVLAALNHPETPNLRDRILDLYTWDVAARVTKSAYLKALNLDFA